MSFGYLKRLPKAWLQNTMVGLKLRNDFDAGNTDSREWFEILQESERCVPCGNYAMSELSREMLEGKLDVSDAITKRRNNFNQLLEELEPWALFKRLPDSVVPLGFPVRIENRNQVQKRLFAEEIYPPIHWSLDGIGVDAFKESVELSREIMTLPCDQRYGDSEMSWLGQSFRSIAANSVA
jgi:hypothetical protein